jgi:hypothetical protein
MTYYAQLDDLIVTILSGITTLKGGANYGIKDFRGLTTGLPCYMILPLEDEEEVETMGEGGDNIIMHKYRIILVDDYTASSAREDSMRSLVDEVRTAFTESPFLGDESIVEFSTPIGGSWGFITDDGLRLYEFDLLIQTRKARQ